MNTHEIVDFGSGPLDETQDYPFAGSEDECRDWLTAHQETRDGRDRYAMQYISLSNDGRPIADDDTMHCPLCGATFLHWQANDHRAHCVEVRR